MENKECNCSECEHWEECEIGLIVHNPILDVSFGVYNGNAFKISKGDKVAQCTLKEHKGFLLGYETNIERIGGYGSTGN